MPTLEGDSYLLLDKGVINMTIASEAMVTLKFCAPPFEQKYATLKLKFLPVTLSSGIPHLKASHERGSEPQSLWSEKLKGLTLVKDERLNLLSNTKYHLPVP